MAVAEDFDGDDSRVEFGWSTRRAARGGRRPDRHDDDAGKRTVWFSREVIATYRGSAPAMTLRMHGRRRSH